jgi:hypothetical protein
MSSVRTRKQVARNEDQEEQHANGHANGSAKGGSRALTEEPVENIFLFVPNIIGLLQHEPEASVTQLMPYP